jgi:predicted kinase
MREVVVVSGAPGAGKTTLAVPLAQALGFPLLSKDAIKETLFDVLGHTSANELESSRRLGAAAMTLLWRLAADCPAVVIEANFRSASEQERTRLQKLSPTPVEVYCRLAPAVAAARYNERGARADHHRVHVVRSISAAELVEFQAPFALGPVIEADTTYPIDVVPLAAAVRQALDEILPGP